MEEAIAEWAVCLIEMVLSVESIEAVPAELIFAFRAFHEFATTRSHYTYLTGWTEFSEKHLVQITVQSKFSRVEIGQFCEERLLLFELKW